MIPVIKGDSHCDITNQLCARIEDLEHDKLSLLEEIDTLRQELEQARQLPTCQEVVTHG